MLCFFRNISSFKKNSFIASIQSDTEHIQGWAHNALSSICPTLEHGFSELPTKYSRIFTGVFCLDLQPPTTDKWLERKVAIVC